MLIVRQGDDSKTGNLRHLAQAIVSVCHMYGVALYYGTCHFDFVFKGVSHSRPEFLYYWVYYVGMNAPWVVVPSSKWFFSGCWIDVIKRLGG